MIKNAISKIIFITPKVWPGIKTIINEDVKASSNTIKQALKIKDKYLFKIIQYTNNYYWLITYNKFSDKMRIAIVSGKDEGPTKLNAFDNALTDAGIGDVNLIKVSSMLSGNAEITELPKLKAGAMVNCVLSEVTSDNPGDEISAVVAVAIGEELGCVVETTGINKNKTDLINEAEFMVKYMMEKRGVEIQNLIVESSTAKVENTASVVASVVYLNDDIIEE